MRIAVYQSEMSDGTKAEGTCKSLPYTSELVNINGVQIHFWCGSLQGRELGAALRQATRAIRWRRDVVYVTYQNGAPDGFWAHEDIP